ncbi:MAG: Nif11-like leader peptide family RiPP precursor [Rivularia sp. (in: cyanobacteria)]
MTITAAKTFLEKVEQDQALLDELTQALQAEQNPQAVMQLASEKGYDFSLEELQAEINKYQAQQTESEELSDEDLETVAGGFTWAQTGLSFLGGILSGLFDNDKSNNGNILENGVTGVATGLAATGVNDLMGSIFN